MHVSADISLYSRITGEQLQHHVAIRDATAVEPRRAERKRWMMPDDDHEARSGGCETRVHTLEFRDAHVAAFGAVDVCVERNDEPFAEPKFAGGRATPIERRRKIVVAR